MNISNNTLLELMLHIKTLTNEVYLVGGCVRDMLLHKSPKDFDVVTDVDLDQLTKVLLDNGWKVDEAGKQFLVLIASKNKEQFEIALFREDSKTSDGRRPDSVTKGSMETDYIRRDFSINSMYYNPFTNELLDPSGNGQKDLKDKVIRFNGKPAERIQEDFLRIFRAYRFSSQLGFNIHPKTLKACRTYFDQACKTVSGQRILIEVEKMSL